MLDSHQIYIGFLLFSRFSTLIDRPKLKYQPIRFDHPLGRWRVEISSTRSDRVSYELGTNSTQTDPWIALTVHILLNLIPYFSSFSFLKKKKKKLRGCLVGVSKQQFSIFKQHFTYFHTLFYPHVFPSKFLNNNF